MLWLLLPTASAERCAEIADLLERLAHEACPTTTLLTLSDLQCDDPRLAEFTRARTPQASPPPPALGKGLRDSYGMAFAMESENFVLRWGSSGSWPESRAEAVLDSFEAAWSMILEDMDYVFPSGSDEYKFNLYIGDTGGPGAYGSAYYTRDSNSWPMIVITPGTFEDASWGSTVGAHEFYHALQDASGAPYQYGNNSLGAWYWEATANWIETEIYPENQAQSLVGFLMGYALLPQLPIHFFDYPDGDGGLGEYHQYGAFIFPYFLSREIADAELIRSSWLEASSSDPLAVLDAGLQADWQTDIDTAFFEFAASNVTWERYDDGDVFAYYVEAYGDHFGSKSARVVAEEGADSDGWQDAPSSTLPQRYGTNNLVITPEGEDVEVWFRGEATGSSGGAANWDVRAVLIEDGSGTIVPVVLSEGTGSAVLEGSADADEVWLVVSVISESTVSDESFAWSYLTGEHEAMADTGTATDTGEDADAAGPVNSISPVTESSCACQGSAFLSGVLLLPLAWARRRR